MALASSLSLVKCAFYILCNANFVTSVESHN